MAFRIDPTLPTGQELRRVFAEQLDRAAAQLRSEGGPDAEAVRDARKNLKKGRAVLRLARGDLGTAVARHANAELKRVGDALATQRDADALVEAADRLRDAALDAPTIEALARVRATLSDRAEVLRTTGALDRRTIVGAALTLNRTVSWVALVPPRAQGWEALASGFGRQYRDGRAGFVDLPRHPSADELHEWRKRVKDLWYHQRLLRGLWPDAQRPVIASADALARTLGDAHDLAMLVACICAVHEAEDAVDGTHVAVHVEPYDRHLVLALAGIEQSRYEAVARDLGAHVFADDPKAWVARHGAWWKAAEVGARTAPAASREGGHDPSPARVTA
jgi:CHAD domain-containing protein